MKAFAELIFNLRKWDTENNQIRYIKEYFSISDDRDCIWAIYILLGKKIKNEFRSKQQLKKWACEYAEIPDWLFDESYSFTGDLTETISLILPGKEADSGRTLTEWMHYMESFCKSDDQGNKKKVVDAWKELDHTETYVFNKLIPGNFKSGVDEKVIIKALSKFLNIESNVISNRIKSNWHPDLISFYELFSKFNPDDIISKPYPFIPEEVFESEPGVLGSAADWLAEQKFKGIRCQLIFRKGKIFLWTDNGELINDKFPEFEFIKKYLPDDSVFTGSIICINNGMKSQHNYLQARLRRKNISSKSLKESPVIFMMNDLLEYEGTDMRNKFLIERKELIKCNKFMISKNNLIKYSENIKFENWEELRTIRRKSSDTISGGIILKKKNSLFLSDINEKYLICKPEPLSADAVLMYALKGERTDLFSEFTLGVWDKGKLVSIAKINSGLSEEEIREVSEFVNNNTLEKFGPVRTVRPELVFNISFESISFSVRHKSGVVLQSPEISKWIRGKNIFDASSLENLKKFIK